MANIFINEETWRDYFEGWEIVDLAIRDRNIIYVGARKSLSSDAASRLADHDIPTRLVGIYLDEPSGKVNGKRLNVGRQELSGMAMPVVGVSRSPFEKPTGMVSAKNRDGDTWPMGSGLDGPMEYIAPGKWPFPEKLKCLGDYTYSVGASREIYKRVAVGQWKPLQEGFPQAEASSRLGFRDMDAFSESDMYAVGGHGDVWHYDGSKWKQMGFPTNVQLGTVTCAGDGNVYVSGEGGSLWVGNKSTWKRLYEGQASILWNDALWFQDQLWLSSDYQFKLWDGKQLQDVRHEGQRVFISGHMDVYDGLLAIAGSSTVMTFDGKQWRTIVSPY